MRSEQEQEGDFAKRNRLANSGPSRSRKPPIRSPARWPAGIAPFPAPAVVIDREHGPVAVGGIEAPRNSNHREPFTMAEVERLIAAAPSPDWRGMIFLAVFTGLRLGDCRSLTWGNVDLAGGVVSVNPAKSRGKVALRVPLHSRLREFLEGHPIADDDNKSPVFPSLANQKPEGRTGLCWQFVRIMEAAKVSRGTVVKVGRNNHQRSFHSLRHTCASLMAEAGVSPELRRAITGHLSAEVHRAYTHHSEGALREAVEAIGK